MLIKISISGIPHIRGCRLSAGIKCHTQRHNQKNGNKLDNSIPIEIHKTEFQRYLDANGGDKIVEVNLNGEVRNCKITEVQIDGVKEGFLHINFLLV